MASVISMWCGIFLGLKLTKLFGICNFSGAKDSGKVLIIMIYYFYIFFFVIAQQIFTT